MSDSTASLVESGLTGEWAPPLRPVFNCPPSAEPVEDICECGFVGEWDRRWVYTWNDVPGFRRTDRIARDDLARGFPPRIADEGWWVMAGWDERCPGCRDIERFDMNANCVARFAATAPLRLMP